ncbi:hypothetical protein GIB67_000382 [Kingdonia uniflora]|uniref:Diphthamide biosynthesis protein 3 n=1 Tax=Kingdonia uniflora TaxID=39325 RepID=A0A7J7MH64_9MAGN|nr:hypothetical protein GIB67_000381 [Kingdonia uniflora]KAF6154104.1 hypothetical protein GIB67_000382 [Kingdonia uniflora]
MGYYNKNPFPWSRGINWCVANLGGSYSTDKVFIDCDEALKEGTAFVRPFPIRCKWEPLEAGKVLINCVEALKEDKGGFGVIIRHFKDDCLASACGYSLAPFLFLYHMLHAIELGIKLAITKGRKRLSSGTDSSYALIYKSGNAIPSWEAKAILNSIFQMIRTLNNNCLICHLSLIRVVREGKMSYDDVEIEDMEWNEEIQAFTYPCPCGDLFQITKEELKFGEEIARCPSCSLYITVIYDMNDFIGESNSNSKNKILDTSKQQQPVIVT